VGLFCVVDGSAASPTSCIPGLTMEPNRVPSGPVVTMFAPCGADGSVVFFVGFKGLVDGSVLNLGASAACTMLYVVVWLARCYLASLH
jgi:hypothetical protein